MGRWRKPICRPHRRTPPPYITQMEDLVFSEHQHRTRHGNTTYLPDIMATSTMRRQSRDATQALLNTQARDVTW